MLTTEECRAKVSALRERAAVSDAPLMAHLLEIASGWEALAAHAEMHVLMADVLTAWESQPPAPLKPGLQLVPIVRTQTDRRGLNRA
jgi:hypothetical protein